MIAAQRAVSDNAVIELLETKAFFSLPKIYRDIIRSAKISDKERCFIYELFFDFLEHWRKGSNNNRLGVTVKSLAEKYQRGVETIRRYLRSLENAGLIRKVLGTVKRDNKILTPIIGIDFILPDAVTQDALSQDNRISVDKSEKNLAADNKNDHSPQQKTALQDNKTVEHLLDQDQIEELLDLIIRNTAEKSYQHTITKLNLHYIIRRFKDLPFHMGFQMIKQTIGQMLFDLNKDGWHTDDPRYRLNIILKKIANNTYKIYIQTEQSQLINQDNVKVLSGKNSCKESILDKKQNQQGIIEYLESQVEQGIDIDDINTSQMIVTSWLDKNITLSRIEMALNSILEQTGTASINTINKFIFKHENKDIIACSN